MSYFFALLRLIVTSISNIHYETGYLIIITSIILTIILNRVWFYWCKNCKKLFAFQKQPTYIAHSEQISVKMKTKLTNNQGNTYGEGEQYIPGTRNFYETPYKCKYCGTEKYMVKMRQGANL